MDLLFVLLLSNNYCGEGRPGRAEGALCLEEKFVKSNKNVTLAKFRDLSNFSNHLALVLFLKAIFLFFSEIQFFHISEFNSR